MRSGGLSVTATLALQQSKSKGSSILRLGMWETTVWE